jgi:hypothetical protein
MEVSGNVSPVETMTRQACSLVGLAVGDERA